MGTPNALKCVINFLYPSGNCLTGQELASRMILSLIKAEDWPLREIRIPVFERAGNRLWSALSFTARVSQLWLRIFLILFQRRPIVYLNLGQSLTSLLRDGLPIRLLGLLRPGIRSIISLHGHWFTEWQAGQLNYRLFRWIVRPSTTITVLGDSQKQALQNMGIRENQIEYVPNTCDVTPLTDDEIVRKQTEKRPIFLLFLSNLINTKGYAEYVEALSLLSKEDLHQPVHGILCGNIVRAGFSEKTESTESIEKWLLGKMTEINQSRWVTIEWIKGAYGPEKDLLFRNAHIFVFPSRIEAQPIVLIEAMASGCAIITNRVGEVPSTLGENTGVILDSPDPQQLALQITRLIEDREAATAMALNGCRRWQSMFTKAIYRDRWRRLFTQLLD